MRQKGFTPLIIILAVTILGIFVYFAYKNDFFKILVIPRSVSNVAANLKTYEYVSPQGGYLFSFNYPNNWIMTGYQDQSSRIEIAKNNDIYKNINIGLLETKLPYSKGVDSTIIEFGLQVFYLKKGDLSEFYPKSLTGDYVVEPISKSVLSVGKLNAIKTVSKSVFLKLNPTYDISYFIQNKNIGTIIKATIPASLWPDSKYFQTSLEDLIKSFVLKIQK